MNTDALAIQKETFIINLGPQHPATHGVLRLLLTMDGEYVLDAEPVIGYGHRMHEKMGENRQYVQFFPNTSRLDYGAGLIYNFGYACAVERLAGIPVPERAEYIRVITAELNRIASHLLWFGAFLIDLGGMTPLLYAFDVREKILDVLQSVTGSRLTFSYFRFGGVCNDVDDSFIQGTRELIPYAREHLAMYRRLVTGNIILHRRLDGIGHINDELCRKYGATGAVLRGAGVNYDVRKNEPYSIYPRFKFDIPVFPEGDCMARYNVRMEEMEQSLRIVEQALDQLPAGPVQTERVPRNLKPPKGECYFNVEGARGSFGIRIISDGSEVPYRMKLRTPCYCNLSLFREAARGMLLPDMLAMLGSLDLNIPDMDR